MPFDPAIILIEICLKIGSLYPETYFQEYSININYESRNLVT